MKTGSMRAGRQDVSKTIGSNETLSPIEVSNLLRASPLSVKLLRASTKRRILGRPSNDGLNPQLSVEIQREPLNGWERLIKRALDLVLAVVAAVLLAPVLLMTAVAIKIDSNGPVLFRQRRVGFDNREFLIYKCRTMTVMDEVEAVVQAQRGEWRVTRIGKLLAAPASTSFRSSSTLYEA